MDRHISVDILGHVAAHLTTTQANKLFRTSKQCRALASCPKALVDHLLGSNGSPSSALHKLSRYWQKQQQHKPELALAALRYLLTRSECFSSADTAQALESALAPMFQRALAATLLDAGAPVTVSVLEAAVAGCGTTADSDAGLGPVHLLIPHFVTLFNSPSNPLQHRARPLAAAAAQNKAAALASLLPAFPTAELPPLRDQLLLTAAQNGAHACMGLLLGQGCSREAKDAALLESARRGSVAAVLLALQHGADVHVQQDLALKEAAEYEDAEHMEVVKVLIRSGADVHVDQDSPLRAASSHGHTDVVALLLRHGAHVTAQGGAALVAACMHGHCEVAQLLLARGAPVNAQQGMPLIRAAAQGHAALVALLLSRGADVHAQYDAALVAAARGGHLLVVQQLLAAGADVTAEENAALCEAVAHGHVPVIRTLLAHGADVCALEDDVEALCRAATRNHWAALDVVLRAPGARCALLEGVGPTLLVVAGRAGCAAVVALLLSLGVAERGLRGLARSSSTLVGRGATQACAAY